MVSNHNPVSGPILLDNGSGEKQIEKTKISNLDSHPRKHIPRTKSVSPYGFGGKAGGLSRMLDRSSQSGLGESSCINAVYQAATNHLLKIKTPSKLQGNADRCDVPLQHALRLKMCLVQ